MCTECVKSTHTKPHAWVHRRIRRYMRQGLSKEEAEQRCYGAYNSRGKTANVSIKGALYKQDDVKYTEISPDSRICSNCRWYSTQKDTMPCHIVWDAPLAIVPNGVCDKWEGMPSGSTVNAWVYTAAGENSQKGLTPGIEIFKADGTEYMRIVTSNSYRDREKQWITTQALAEYVESEWDGNRFKGTNYVLYFHRKIPIGRIVWADMVGPFLVEIAEKRHSNVLRFQTYIDRTWARVKRSPGYYGASHGFRAGPDDLRKGTFTRIEKFETSVLPRRWAANVLTSSEVIE